MSPPCSRPRPASGDAVGWDNADRCSGLLRRVGREIWAFLVRRLPELNGLGVTGRRRGENGGEAGDALMGRAPEEDPGLRLVLSDRVRGRGGGGDMTGTLGAAGAAA